MDPPAVPPHVPGEYQHPERDVVILSRRHLVALSVVLALFALHLQLNRNWPGYYRGPPPASNDDSDEGESWRCAENVSWTTFPDRLEGLLPPYMARTSFNIPISASSISFLARDRTASYGSFRVSQTGGPASEAVVEIEARYWSQEMVENVRVCRLRPRELEVLNGENPWRFAITSDKELDRKAEINIHLRLPASLEPDSPLVINDLWTILPFYSHRFEGLSQLVRFRRLSLMTRESDITVDPAILGDVIDAHSTALGSIRGTFNVSESLYVTTGGAIELHANLLDGRAPDNHDPVLVGMEPPGNTAPTRLHMFTGNGMINAQVGIYDTASRNSGAAQTDHTIGRFEVTAKAADAPIDLTFVDAPSDSDYALSVKAEVHVVPEGLPWWWRFFGDPDSSAPITVKMHETFDGSLKLETSKRVRPSVEWAQNEDGTPSVEDPSGRGRERHVQVQSGRGRAEGEVWWGEGSNQWTSRPWDKHRVALKAATSPIRLVLRQLISYTPPAYTLAHRFQPKIPLEIQP